MTNTKPQGTEHAPELLTRKAAEAVRQADPAAFLVPPRVVRRVIRAEHDLTGLGINVPHRKSYVIGAHELLATVEPDELGVTSAAEVPPTAILIAQPGDERLATMGLSELLVRSWSLLFHARVDAAFAALARSGALTPAGVRERIDRIGQVEFDEMHAVLRQEQFLLPPEDPLRVYAEAAAVFCELHYFRPHWLPAWFPAVDDTGRVEAIFAGDVDVAELFKATRPAGAPALPPSGSPSWLVTASGHDGSNGRPHGGHSHGGHSHGSREQVGLRERRTSQERLTLSATQYAEHGRQNQSAHSRLNRRADRAGTRGNSVKAALLRLRAAGYTRRENAASASSAAAKELEHLADRLQAALGFDDEQKAEWREVLAALLAGAVGGFWNAEKRVLHDLQKVCVDHEREISRADLAGWLLSLGKKPIRRPLPNQREVLMSKHLRQAESRLSSLRLTGPERQRLAELLREATHLAEVQLRDRLRPLIRESLEDVGIRPANLPERVAREKIIGELLDAIVRHGFANMSKLRDVLSRNNLKMPDLAGAGELWHGDWLLRADRTLQRRLDGVYHRGEFYLRALQKASSLAFGTRPGRFLTRFVAIPFGGAMIALEGLKHLLDKLYGVEHAAEAVTTAATEGAAAVPPPPDVTHLLSWFDRVHHPLGFWGGIVVVGLFLMGLIHVRRFRQTVADLATAGWRIGRLVFVALPRSLWRATWLRYFLGSRFARWLRERVLLPLVLTVLIWLMFPLLGVYTPGVTAMSLLFMVLAVALSTRMGRDLEELTFERVHETWRRLRAHVFVALFDAVMDFFKRIVETVERVLYAVDEWLRFRSGEAKATLVVKGVLALAWAGVAYFVRFALNLLVEPQVNPIKHFPVVTVSHKILLPMIPTLAGALQTLFSLETAVAGTIATAVIFCIPGVFGFLVWECKENWRLYAANRPPRLAPVLVGSHGESVIRLMKPGFHSGTVPKTYARLRKAERQPTPHRRDRMRSRYAARLHHTVEEVRHFVQRELVNLLAESREMGHLEIVIGSVRVASNSIRVELTCPGLSELSMVLALQEQSGWLVASLTRPGWTVELDEDQRQTLELALAGFYKLAGVDLVREQLQSGFDRGIPPYDVSERGLVIWPCGRFDEEVRYDLAQRPVLRPRPRSVAREHDLPVLSAARTIYHEHAVAWDEWVAAWTAEHSDHHPADPSAVRTVRLLPPLPARPASIARG